MEGTDENALNEKSTNILLNCMRAIVAIIISSRVRDANVGPYRATWRQARRRQVKLVVMSDLP